MTAILTGAAGGGGATEAPGPGLPPPPVCGRAGIAAAARHRADYIRAEEPITCARRRRSHERGGADHMRAEEPITCARRTSISLPPM
jgi:hypothetical protein